ncbi:hypothetical protein H6G06_25215 [Anabaena sphaerica FACHB-251]|uniref:Uncharacterized protein n=1 Tax=Anabaena sphaerica FACHB-251 TaxID=2692883 RepID=A0A927A1Y0_9NOST|nr:hypothetical protein [Anabaena sphaerica]MBD2296692.1 hypothetical protein [Anabaena sphaerica FACHB-251]
MNTQTPVVTETLPMVLKMQPNIIIHDVDKPQTLSGEDILPGFVLDLREIG